MQLGEEKIVEKDGLQRRNWGCMMYGGWDGLPEGSSSA